MFIFVQGSIWIQDIVNSVHTCAREYMDSGYSVQCSYCAREYMDSVYCVQCTYLYKGVYGFRIQYTVYIFVQGSIWIQDTMYSVHICARDYKELGYTENICTREYMKL